MQGFIVRCYVKYFVFFNLILKCFFSELVLIEEQLILIFLWNDRIERRGTEIKKVSSIDDMP